MTYRSPQCFDNPCDYYDQFEGDDSDDVDRDDDDDDDDDDCDNCVPMTEAEIRGQL